MREKVLSLEMRKKKGERRGIIFKMVQGPPSVNKRTVRQQEEGAAQR